MRVCVIEMWSILLFSLLCFVHYLNFYGPCIVLSIFYMIYNFLAMHFSILYILLISIVYNCHFLCIRSICCICLCNCYFTAVFYYFNFYAPFIMLSIFYLHFCLLHNYVIYVPICNLFELYIITISCVY